jgi:hypothetical protein
MNLLAASVHLANGSCGIGILSRDPAAASDAFFNQYGRDPVVSGKRLTIGAVDGVAGFRRLVAEPKRWA